MTNDTWPNGLPEHYGEGQRQYDMALTAKSAAEPWVFAACACGAYVAMLLTGSWLALAVGVPAYLISMRPLNRNLATASAAWMNERESWSQWLNRNP